MIYITARQHPREKKKTWEELLIQEESVNKNITDGAAGTVTRVYEEIPEEILSKINVSGMIQILKDFNTKHENLYLSDKASLYKTFFIPKQTTGMRQIDEPNDELKAASNELVEILKKKIGLLYHTSGYAYIEKRNTYQCARKHVGSNWFFHTDIKGFFPSTTLEFTMRIMKMIFPVSEICKSEEGYKELEKALSIVFLNNSLPQGNPASPLISNLVSIPIDFKIFNELSSRKFKYTRYADDVYISSETKFDKERMRKYIQSVYDQFQAPWALKPEKTRYNSKAGRNIILGLHLNNEDKITVGYKNKKYFKAMTANLMLDYKNDHIIDRTKVREYQGLLSYYQFVEPEYFDKLEEHFYRKYRLKINNVVRILLS